MNEFVDLLGAKRSPLHISLQNAKDILRRGLIYFLNDKAQWVQGYDEIANWLMDNNNKGLLLYGSNGRGKSLMVRQIIPTIMQFYFKPYKTFSCRGIELYTLCNKSQEYYEMISSRVTFIDDFGVEDITNHYGVKYDVFSDVVDLAEIDKRILVLSTNLTPDEIERRYGKRTIDRLHALTTPICFVGESLRGK